VTDVAGQAVPGLRIVEVDPQGAVALGLLREAAIEARALYPELVDPNAPWPTNGPTPPGGIYLVAYWQRSPVACGALRPLEDGVAEIRRMFVTRHARRQGMARAVLQELEAQALKRGYKILRLETGYRQAPAIGLYRHLGYAQIEPFGEYAGDPTSVCFEKAIAPGTRKA
jgi:putative acetyltransferase